MPWLSVLSNGTWGEHRGQSHSSREGDKDPQGCSAMSSTLRMKQNSELSKLASVLIWMHLEKKPRRSGQQELGQLWPPALPLPGGWHPWVLG